MSIEDRGNIFSWLANGKTGLSSKAIAFAFIGVDFENGSPPSDPSDFNRCLLLLERIPEAWAGVEKLAEQDEVWAALRDRWSELTDMFVAEVGWNWSTASSAPKTYNFMKQIGC